MQVNSIVIGKNNMNTDQACEIIREESRGYFDQYWKHASVLRNWFVAYGIGALALVIHNNGLFFKDTESKKLFVTFIVLGISLQIILTFINKIIHWFIYYGKNSAEFQKTKKYKMSDKISRCFGIDIAADILTILLYASAIIVFVLNL